MNKEKSLHQERVEELFKVAGQEIPEKPTIPSKEIRLLRAKLILEEALETIEALGVSVYNTKIYKIFFEDLDFGSDGEPNLSLIVDGCLDLRVVTTGCLSACGVKDNNPQLLVDQNNLEKLKGWTVVELAELSEEDKDIEITPIGDFKYRIKKGGKLLKPPSHKPPDLITELARQSNLPL